MKLDLKKRYIQKIKDCRNENKRLSKLLNGLENRIEIDFLPQINSQHNIIADLQIRLGNQHRHLTAVDDELEKTNLSYYKIVRAYRGLVIMQNDAKNMGIDNFKMYLIEDFCISLTLILYLNKFTNELNILYGPFKKLG